MFEKFTDRSRKVMRLANMEAQRWNHEVVRPEHVLIALVKEKGGVGGTVLRDMGVDLRKLLLELEKMWPAGKDMILMGELPLTPRCCGALEKAVNEATALNHNHVGTEHLLLGLLKDDAVGQMLDNLKVDREEARSMVMLLVGEKKDVEKNTPMDKALAWLRDSWWAQEKRFDGLRDKFHKLQEVVMAWPELQQRQLTVQDAQLLNVCRVCHKRPEGLMLNYGEEYACALCIVTEPDVVK